MSAPYFAKALYDYEKVEETELSLTKVSYVTFKQKKHTHSHKQTVYRIQNKTKNRTHGYCLHVLFTFTVLMQSIHFHIYYILICATHNSRHKKTSTSDTHTHT